MSRQLTSASRFLTAAGSGSEPSMSSSNFHSPLHAPPLMSNSPLPRPPPPNRLGREAAPPLRAPRHVDRALDHRVGLFRHRDRAVAGRGVDLRDLRRRIPRRHLLVEPLHLAEHRLGGLRGAALARSPPAPPHPLAAPA